MTTERDDAKKKKKRRFPRLERPKKQYGLDQCALYKVKSFGTLLRVLRWPCDRDNLERLATRRGSYKVWTEKNGRRVQAASPILRRVQARIAVLLRRVAPPDYRQSGVRGRSFISNAAQHLADEPAIKFDIKSFYPSTTFNHVRNFFKIDLACGGDIAYLLATLCCYLRLHLPTGGVHSEVVAFYAHKKIFDAFEQRVRNRTGKFTIYVDDGMATMPGACHSDLQWLRNMFSGRGIVLHPKKTIVIRKGASRTLTGVNIVAGRTRAPISQHRKVKTRFEDMAKAHNIDSKRKAIRSLLGHLEHIAHIDSEQVDKAVGNRARLKNELSNTHS